MQVQRISAYNNLNYTGRRVPVKNFRLPQQKSTGADSVLLYFAGLLSAFGFNRPLKNLLNILRKSS